MPSSVFAVSIFSFVTYFRSTIIIIILFCIHFSKFLTNRKYLQKNSLLRKMCWVWANLRLNMELDLQNLFGLLCTAVLIGWDSATSPLPPHPGSYTRALLVSQDRRHLFVTPWSKQKNATYGFLIIFTVVLRSKYRGLCSFNCYQWPGAIDLRMRDGAGNLVREWTRVFTTKVGQLVLL